MEFLWEKARSVFLSDLHLGWRLSKPDVALEFLSRCTPQDVYLVGDTFEGLHQPLNLQSPAAARIMHVLNDMCHRGTRVTILAGNHDHHLAGMTLDSRFRTGSHAIHTTQDGKRFLVTHGDIFDFVDSGTHSRVRQLGSWIYPRLVHFGDALIQWGMIRKVRKEHWCTYWKLKSRRARRHIEAFERAMVAFAHQYDCEGVICGHIHRPACKQLDQRWYLNCGDWVEHRSCILETQDGQLQLVEDLAIPLTTCEAA
ncbi:MAG: UDP-2,3-diacylglucosamine diphosphatase [Pirellula sp.]|nr:UDP-2,3-diacylglucosamine diphosphatase [Pirellula sp.]